MDNWVCQWQICGTCSLQHMYAHRHTQGNPSNICYYSVGFYHSTCFPVFDWLKARTNIFRAGTRAGVFKLLPARAGVFKLLPAVAVAEIPEIAHP